jgi:uncharacterized protein (DUF1697 family)
MQKWIALFRGINVGGNNLIPMKELTALLNSMGCQKVNHYIQSGNLLFEHKDTDKAFLSSSISEKVNQDFGISPQVLLVELSDFILLAKQNPFVDAEAEPASLHLYFLARSPKSPDLEKLNQLKSASEDFVLAAEVFYLHAPDGIGRSKLAAKVESCLGVSTTARNWNTVNKLVSMAQSIEVE